MLERNPRVDDWSEAVSEFKVPAWDPAFLVDDDGRLYLYHGSGNSNPLYGIEIDPKTFDPIGEQVALIELRDDLHGWERFGEANDNTFLRPFIEGPWTTKHEGRYYLQYAAPGTEFSGYADGVYVSEQPLGPFRYQDHNPFSYRPGGYARGAGHGSTFQDRTGRWWHTSTIAICVKNNFERRIGIWPCGFDAEGIMHCDTAYGDYPTLVVTGEFAEWMLLNYGKPVRASSSLSAFPPNNAVDENIRTYWSAQSGDAGEWFESDLGEASSVMAIQINFADQDAEFMGKMQGIYHRYRLMSSMDGDNWEVIADKSQNETDVPHDYVELPDPVAARFVRIECGHLPTGKFALSGLRVFGLAHRAVPAKVDHFVALRGDSERRNAWLKWQASSDATGYVVRSGVAPGKMYTSVMVVGANEITFRAMDRDRAYYFQIEAFNEGGISERTEPILVR